LFLMAKQLAAAVSTTAIGMTMVQRGRRLLQPGDVVFIKASRSVGLENFAATLQEDGPARPAR
jgi:UDP-N-acetylmuramyl pentapeptide synthase